MHYILSLVNILLRIKGEIHTMVKNIIGGILLLLMSIPLIVLSIKDIRKYLKIYPKVDSYVRLLIFGMIMMIIMGACGVIVILQSIGII